jgi:hypothetical protein
LLKLSVYRSSPPQGDPNEIITGEDVKHLISNLYNKTLMKWSGKLNGKEVHEQIKLNDVIEGEVWYPKGDKIYWFIVERI